MDLMYMNHDREDLGVLKNPEFDLAFGEDENNFECKISLKDHCCKEGYYIYAEGTEYGGIVDAIEIDSENDLAIYTGRSWHGILASKVIEPLKSTDKTEITAEVETEVDPELQLPEGYTRLKSIESTGTQYINTGYVPNENTEVELTFQLTNPDTTNQALFAVNGQFSFRWYGSGQKFRSNGSNSVDFPTGIDPTAQHTVIKTATKTTIDNTHTVATLTGTVSHPLYLFAQNTGTSVINYSKQIVPQFIIRENGTKLIHYIPCKNPSNEVGMYDIVNKKFRGNDGTGVFIAGEEISEGTTIKQITVGTVKTKDTDGTSLVNRHLTISGDAGYCAKYIVDRINLAPLFVCSEKLTDVDLSAYKFERYIDAYSGLRDMLASCGMRLAVTCEENTVKLSAVPIFDGSDGKEMESDLIEYQMKKTYNNVNHLICMGNGSYANRQIVHLYLDAEGNVSETQTFTGVDERIQFDGEQGEPEEPEEAKTAEQLAEEKANLIENGTKKLLDLQAEDEIDVSFDSADDNYYIGDIVGAYDSVTDISVSAEVVKKIISISRGRVNIEYRVGARNG